MKVSLLGVIVLMLSALVVEQAHAQDISKSKVTWRATEITGQGTPSSKPMSCEFVTNASRSVQWVQRKGALTTQFRVTGTEGSWANIASYGTFNYQLDYNGQPCRMTLERSSAGIFIVMDFIKNGQTASQLRFAVNAVN